MHFGDIKTDFVVYTFLYSFICRRNLRFPAHYFFNYIQNATPCVIAKMQKCLSKKLLILCIKVCIITATRKGKNKGESGEKAITGLGGQNECERFD